LLMQQHVGVRSLLLGAVALQRKATAAPNKQRENERERESRRGITTGPHFLCALCRCCLLSAMCCCRCCTIESTMKQANRLRKVVLCQKKTAKLKRAKQQITKTTHSRGTYVRACVRVCVCYRFNHLRAAICVVVGVDVACPVCVCSRFRVWAAACLSVSVYMPCACARSVVVAVET
jgi:hypothetical protein